MQLGNPNHKRRVVFRFSVLLGLSLLMGGNSVIAQTFDERRKKISLGIETQSEDAVRAFLASGLAEHKVSQAHSVVAAWFLQNTPQSPQTLYLAAQVAEQSADYPAAVAFYQQFVAKADPKSKDSQHAVMRLYRLMVDVMANKNNSAYLYMLNHAERLMPYGAARQYNTWLLDQAWKGYESNRRDLQDYLNVLTAVCRSGYSKVEMEVFYGEYFGRVYTVERRYVGALNVGENLANGEALAELGKAISHDERLKREFTFLGQVWRYNTALYQAMEHNKKKGVAPKVIPSPPLAAAEAYLKAFPDAAPDVWSEFRSSIWRNHAGNWTFSKEGEGDAKKALFKKYLKTMPPDARYQLKRNFLSKHDKSKHKLMTSVDWRNPPKDVKLMSSKTPEDQRLKEFRTLIADFDSASPKQKHVYARLIALVGSTPSVWPEMMKTDERQWILHEALRSRLRLNTTSLEYAADPHSKHAEDPHWSEPHLRKLVKAQADAGKLPSWLTMAWVNSYKPQWAQTEPKSDPAALELMKKVMSMPQYSALPYPVRRGMLHASRYKVPEAQKVGGMAWDGHVFGELRSLDETADSAALKAACKTTLARLEASPKRVDFRRYDELNTIPPAVFEDSEALALMLQVLDNPSVSAWVKRGDKVYDPILNTLIKSPDAGVIQRHAHMLWQRSVISNTGRRGSEQVGRRTQKMLAFSESLIETSPSAGATMARAGLHLTSRNKTIEGLRSALGTYLNRANLAMGIRSIAVDESDPAYPLFKSQSEFATGNEDSAWQLFDDNMETGLSMHRKLSADYWLWVLERLVYQGEEERQERVVTMLRAWRKESSTAFSKGQSVMLDILYGDIARRQGGQGMDNALKIYREISKKPEYAGTPEVFTAMLRTIEVQRTMKDFGGALETAQNLIRMRIPELWATARYAKAAVYHDMENFDDAKELIVEILAREPNHKDAKILEGKVLIKQKSLLDATEVDIVSRAVTQEAISPGEWLTVRLTDPTLAVGGSGASIEVDVWATSGDRETILLSQFGDNKTKFRGRVRVELGQPRPGDKELQVIGDDEIYYAYSKRFMDKVNMKDPKQGGPLTVVSDAVLMASARKLLSVAEQKQADAAALARQLVKQGGNSKKSNEELLEMANKKLEERALTRGGSFNEGGMSDDQHRQLQNTLVKPGNLIYLRVVDEDRSRTADVDQLLVSVEASSGDIVGRIVLKETDTHTGVFEGALPTGNAQAMAFATSTRSGLNPNMIISPASSPAWQAAAGGKKGSSVITLDLNDNVPLETLTIIASEPNNKLKKFRLLTGINRSDLKAAAFWPARAMAKNPLAPSLLIAEQPSDRQVVRDHKGRFRTNYGNTLEQAYSLKAISNYLKNEYPKHGQSYEGQLTGPAQAFSLNVLGKAPWIKTATSKRKDDRNLTCRFRAHFYEPESTTRVMAVALGKVPSEISVPRENGMLKMSGGEKLPVYVTVNGQPLEWTGKTFSGNMNLKTGLQTIEIFSQGAPGGIGFGRACKVYTRFPHESSWAEMPDSRFDPSTFPEDIAASAVVPPQVNRSSDGTQWTIRFSPGARARVLAFELLEHEGAQPAVNKVRLTAVGGKQILPVATDYKEARKNNVLEILSGDQIWVRYIDDRFVTASKERQERVLSAGYSDGSVHFAKHNPDAPSYAFAIHQSQVRFKENDVLSLSVYDPDMDVTDKPDVLTVTVKSRSGRKANVQLTEVTKSKGIFSGAIYVVNGQTAKAGQIQCVDDDVLTLSYWDKENRSHGVPIERKVSIIHARYKQPKMVMSHMTMDPSGKHNPKPEQVVDPNATPIKLMPTQIKPGAHTVTIFPGRPAYIDIIAPHLQLRRSSKVEVFAQTERGRRLAEQQRRAAMAAANAEGQTTAPAPRTVFDVTVPGTRLLTALPVESDRRWHNPDRLRLKEPLGVYSVNQPNPFDTYWLKSPMKGYSGVFRAELFCQTDFHEELPLQVSSELLLRYATAGGSRRLSEAERQQVYDKVGISRLGAKHWDKWIRLEDRSKLLDPLIVEPGENVYIGMRYEDDKGQAHWITATAKTATHGKMAVSALTDNVVKTGALSLGDRLNVRVTDMGFDTSHDVDSLSVQVTAQSGASYPLELKESDPHSAIFEGSFELVINQGQSISNRNLAVFGFPADYNDTVQLAFTDSAGRELRSKAFSLTKGSDGMIEPFTKQYGDDEIAVQTQFAMAEAYLEAAKSYKKTKQDTEALLNYETAQQLLLSTLDRFTDPNAHARAEYLLGDLSYESARSTADPEEQKQQYYAALARFNKVVANYSETVDAPKAQFKKAVTYERLKESEAAAQEYVKLAYMYPDSEFLAVAMYRLGVHFRSKAKRDHRELAVLQQKMAGLSAETVDRDLRFEIDQLSQEVLGSYAKAGKIFGRMQERFPTHELAGKGGLRSAQCYYAAGDYDAALSPLNGIADGENYAIVERAEAMYWMGKSYANLGDNLAAYSSYLRCTEDYPETEWAGYCLSELSQPALKAVETSLNKQISEERKAMGLEKK